MRQADGNNALAHLLLNIVFGGLPGRLGADVDRTRLALAIIWYSIDRLERASGDTRGTRFQFVTAAMLLTPF